MKQSATRSGLYQSGSYTTLSDISDYAQNLFDVGFDELKTPDSQSKSVSLERRGRGTPTPNYFTNMR